MFIQESGMNFGPFNKNEIFYIEKEPGYNKIFSDGVKTVEFILNRKRLFFIEAKSTSPNVENNDSQQSVEQYVDEIIQKFNDSLHLFSSVCIGKNHTTDTPVQFFENDYSKKEFVLVLVVKDYYEDSIVELNTLFDKKAKALRKIWHMSNVVVLNEDRARKWRLVESVRLI